MFKYLKQQHDDICSSFNHYYGISYPDERKSKVIKFFDFIFFYISSHFGSMWFKLKILYCKKYGHKYKVEGYANAETGGEELTCMRCGHYIKNIMY